QARPLAAVVGLVLGIALAWALLGRAIPALGPDFTIPGQTHRLNGSIGYPNGLALLAAMAIPLGAWAANERERWARVAGLELVVLAGVAVPLTYSRGGVALAVAAAVSWIAVAASRFR